MGLEQAQTLATVFDGITRTRTACGFVAMRKPKASKQQCKGEKAASRYPSATKGGRWPASSRTKTAEKKSRLLAAADS